MITPRFVLSQCEQTFTVKIRAPYCSLRELDVQVVDDTFLFYCKPYYLRLNLPGKLIENENSQSSFNSELGEFTFTYDKAHPGEDFPDLELITKFLAKKVDVHENATSGRKIEVISSESNEQLEVQIEADYQYGFALRGGYEFKSMSSEFEEIFEVDPFQVRLEHRVALCQEREKRDFNVDHYVADFIESEDIDWLIANKAPWEKSPVKLTDEELDCLKDLPNIKYELSLQQEAFAMNGLLDILYAYMYDWRTTNFEANCESGWTISKLSSTLCAFAAFESPRSALLSAMRRTLIYPLYRNYKLSSKILDDLRHILTQGECQLVKILIQLRRIFMVGSVPRYILNVLFISDYLVFVQQWDRAKWAQIVDEVVNIGNVTKNELDLNLECIENDNSLSQVPKEPGMFSELTGNMKMLRIGGCGDLDSDDDVEAEGQEVSNSPTVV